jgi:hypothetical protein
VLGAIPVTAFVLFMTRARKSAEVSAKACVMVNETPKLTLKPLFLQAFRIDAAQDAQSNAAAIKSKLSGLS